MNIELYCVVCGKMIDNPVAGKNICDSKVCEKEYNKYLNRRNYLKWKVKNKRKTKCQDTGQRGISQDKTQAGD